MNHLKKNDSLQVLKNLEIMPHLLATIKQSTSCIWIVGPWLDAYFVENIIKSLANPDLELYFVVRRDDDGIIDSKTLSALNMASENIKNFHARSLLNLHSKLIITDNLIFYTGSANWYWYSLNKSEEITVTGEISLLPELLKIAKNYWENGGDLNKEELSNFTDFKPRNTPDIN